MASEGLATGPAPILQRVCFALSPGAREATDGLNRAPGCVLKPKIKNQRNYATIPPAGARPEPGPGMG